MVCPGARAGSRRACYSLTYCRFLRIGQGVIHLPKPVSVSNLKRDSVFSQPSIYIDGWLYGMRMTSVVCNVPVLSHISSFYLHDMKVTSLRYLDAKFHHPSLGASPPVAPYRICLPPELLQLLHKLQQKRVTL